MTDEGFDLLPGEHPIVPVMFGDAGVAAASRTRCSSEGVYVIAFSYPVVPQGQGAHPGAALRRALAEDIETCVQAFVAARSGGLIQQALSPG